MLLAILFVSCWQTVAAYPGDGGSYVVARENLGDGAGLLAAALMADCLINVAVGVSAEIVGDRHAGGRRPRSVTF